jgi:transcriptional regulator with XRE-family HTH domain
MTPSQCRAARGLARWSQEEIAKTSGVGETTVSGFETELVTSRSASIQVMRNAFEAAGVIFIDEDARGGPGVRMSKSTWPARCRAARGLLGWTQDTLAQASRVSSYTVARFEGERTAPLRATLRKVRHAFEAAGIIFLEGSDEITGVRLRKGLR